MKNEIKSQELIFDRCIKIVVIFIFGVTIPGFCQVNKQSKFDELKISDKRLYDLLLKVRTDKNTNDIDAIASYFLQRNQADIIQTFLSKTDSSIFKNIPAESLTMDSLSKHKLRTLHACDSLIKLCEHDDFPYIINNIEQLNRLTKLINEGNGLIIMKKLTQVQKNYVTPYVIKAINYCDDYYKVASSYNPTLPPELRKAKLMELSKKYVRPIQQVYINQELANIGQ